MTVKFKFHLKNGKVFECISEGTEGQFVKIIEICKQAMREGTDGVVTLEDCCVRLSECAVVEWEVLK